MQTVSHILTVKELLGTIACILSMFLVLIGCIYVLERATNFESDEIENDVHESETN
jgi:hypothetical protein